MKYVVIMYTDVHAHVPVSYECLFSILAMYVWYTAQKTLRILANCFAMVRICGDSH